MEYTIRAFDCARDAGEVLAVMRNAGWEEEGYDLQADLDKHLPACAGECACASGHAISVVIDMPGWFRYQERLLPLHAVTGVATMMHARRGGAAGRLLARALHRAHDEGAVVSALGAFDQGYYNRLGYGNGCNDVVAWFDPAALNVAEPTLNVVSLGAGDASRMHAARVRRYQWHGACSITPDGFTSGAVASCGNRGFGLGIEEDGALRAHLFGARDCEDGETKVTLYWVCADAPHYLVELFGALKRLADQIEEARMVSPPYFCLQDMVRRPLRKNMHIGTPQGDALFWQLRILDVRRAIEAVSLSAREPVVFNMTLSDPLANMDGSGWRGVAGDYVVTLDEESQCVAGHRAGLPLLEADVGAFSRLWAGVLPARALAVSDNLRGEEALLARLDRVWVAPRPMLDWEF